MRDNMKLHKLIVDDNQLKIIQEALESYSRLGVGQLENVLSDIGFNKMDQFKDNIQELHSLEMEDAIKTIKNKLFNLSFKASYSISNIKVNEDFKICYDLYNAIKIKINSLNINSEWGTSLDNPRKISKNGIIQIELCTKEEERNYAEIKENKEKQS